MEKAYIIKKFKWIFFDLDGTLADSIPEMYRIYICFLSEFGIQGTQEEFEKLNGCSILEIIDYLRTRHLSGKNKESLVKLYKKKIMNGYENYVKPMHEANKVLQNLTNRNYKLLLSTSADQEIALEFIKHQNWEKYFEFYVFGNEIKEGKPAPEIYLLALKKAHISPKLVAVIEDSANGIQSAISSGLFTIGLANTLSKEELLQAGANLAVAQLKDILPFFEIRQ